MENFSGSSCFPVEFVRLPEAVASTSLARKDDILPAAVASPGKTQDDGGGRREMEFRGSRGVPKCLGTRTRREVLARVWKRGIPGLLEKEKMSDLRQAQDDKAFDW
jgi:hypothetical protein